MNSWLGKTLLLILGVVFMLKGGIGLVVGLWKVTLPLILLGGGYLMAKNYILKKKQEELERGSSSRGREQGPKNVRGSPEDVIEICPTCLQEVGSCPACRRGRKSRK